MREEPVYLRTGRRTVAADLGLARRHDDADEFIIVVEVKCFADDSRDLQEFYTALGQYRTYKQLLEEEPFQLPLYLAIPSDAYERLPDIYDVARLFQLDRINLVIIDISQAEVLRWVTYPNL